MEKLTFILILLIPVITGQENSSDTDTRGIFPTILDTLTQTDCRTYYPSTLSDFLCPIPTLAGSLGFCDSHCRCIHKARWGYCEKRPQWAPPGTGFSGLWCRCSYDAPPQDFSPNSFDRISCGVWRGTDLMCTGIQLNATAGCNADCVCTHGFKRGNCDKENYCICSNNEVPNIANPFVGMYASLFGG